MTRATLSLAFAIGCNSAVPIDVPMRDAGVDAAPAVFTCTSENDSTCDGSAFIDCVRDGEFLVGERTVCLGERPVCDPARGCLACIAGAIGCFEGHAARCRDDASGWERTETCDHAAGRACDLGRCESLCELAVRDRSYLGCEFWPVDLDNSAELSPNAQSQQYAVIVSNPGAATVEVTVEVNDAPQGAPQALRAVGTSLIAPGDLEILRLPAREVDGSASGAPTHTALTSQAYRIRTTFPVVAYQFNPLENVGVYSNDASLLLPTSAIGTRYTVSGWPQTIPNGFGSADARAFLTIVGAAANTNVTIQLGPDATAVSGGGSIAPSRAGETIEITLGPFDVLNLESDDFGVDFTGSIVEASAPVVVYSGNELADVPFLRDVRLCCADHLEEQLAPDASLGVRYALVRSPSRTRALNAAFVDPERDRVAELDEPEYFRVLAVAEGTTQVTTTLPAPDDAFTLARGEHRTIRATRESMLEASAPVSVMQLMAGQEAVGLPGSYPGGDPSSILLAPLEQFRRSYVFLTPDRYAFDFVTIVAPREAAILLDGEPAEPLCTRTAADGIARRASDPPPEYVAYECQLSFPEVGGAPEYRVTASGQEDGVHTVSADVPVGIVVTGFDEYVSYGYAGGRDVRNLF